MSFKISSLLDSWEVLELPLRTLLRLFACLPCMFFKETLVRLPSALTVPLNFCHSFLAFFTLAVNLTIPFEAREISASKTPMYLLLLLKASTLSFNHCSELLS